MHLGRGEERGSDETVGRESALGVRRDAGGEAVRRGEMERRAGGGRCARRRGSASGICGVGWGDRGSGSGGGETAFPGTLSGGGRGEVGVGSGPWLGAVRETRRGFEMRSKFMGDKMIAIRFRYEIFHGWSFVYGQFGLTPGVNRLFVDWQIETT